METYTGNYQAITLISLPCLERLGRVGTREGQYSQRDCMRSLSGGPCGHKSICVQAHGFFSDNGGQLTESLLGRQA